VLESEIDFKIDVAERRSRVAELVLNDFYSQNKIYLYRIKFCFKIGGWSFFLQHLQQFGVVRTIL
jgi:hypothetical protein